MKAILVIDEMPKTCEECEFGWWYGTACVIQNCDTHRDETGRDEDCPLKPMQRKIVNRSTEKDNQYYYDLGFNDCIDEILGEEK